MYKQTVDFTTVLA